MTFLGDEGRDMLVVKRMIVDHKFTLLGPTASVGGFFLGPIYYYFMVPFVWAWGLDPTGAAVMVALAGIATIYVVFLVGRDFFDKWVGVIAAALYTVSPVVIAYSRSSWNPNLVPFFSTIVMYFCWQVIVQKRYHLLFWLGVGMGIGLQLHYLFLFLFPVVLVWFLFFGRERKMLRFYGAGLLGFLVGYGPFLAFELRHGFPNTQSIIKFLAHGEGTGLVTSTFLHTIGDVAYRLFGRLLYRLPQPEVWIHVSYAAQQVWTIGIKFSLLSASLLLALYITRRFVFPFKPFVPHKCNAASVYTAILLLLWFFIPLALFGFYQKGIYDYYFG
ncbi:MAG: glycosyltransferase family 39 protein, partial [Pseudomonadota bacterium]